MEISLLRSEVRSGDLTCKLNVIRQFCSPSGTVLDNSLVYFKNICNENYVRYKDSFFAIEKFGGVTFTPVYYTPEERTKKESIENQTTAEIDKMVFELTDIMPSTEYAALFKNAVRVLKGKENEKFIDLYYDVANSLSEQLADADVGTLEPDTFEMVQD